MKQYATHALANAAVRFVWWPRVIWCILIASFGWAEGGVGCGAACGVEGRAPFIGFARHLGDAEHEGVLHRVEVGERRAAVDEEVEMLLEVVAERDLAHVRVDEVRELSDGGSDVGSRMWGQM